VSGGERSSTAVAQKASAAKGGTIIGEAAE